MNSLHSPDTKVQSFKSRLLRASNSREKAFSQLFGSILSPVVVNQLEKASYAFDGCNDLFPSLSSGSEPLKLEQFRSELYAYIQGMTQSVLAPIAQTLEMLGKPISIDTFWSYHYRFFQDRLANIPADFVRPLPLEVYRSDSKDGIGDSARKIAARFQGNIAERIFGIPADQQIPLRKLAIRHFGKRLTEHETLKVKSLYRSLAGSYRPLETACESWLKAFMELDIAIDELEATETHLEEHTQSELFGLHQDLVKNIERFQLALNSSLSDLKGFKSESLNYSNLFTQLESDIDISDTFLSDRNEDNFKPEQIAEIGTKEITLWQAWLKESGNFFSLSSTLSSLRVQTSENLADFSRRLIAHSKDEILVDLDAQLSLNSDIQEQSDAFFENKKKRSSWKSVTAELGSMLELLNHDAESEELQISSNGLVDHWSEKVQSLPITLPLHRSPQNPSIHPESSRYDAKIRRWVEQAFDSLLMDRFRSAPDAIVKQANITKSSLLNSREMVKVALEAAIEFCDADNRIYSLEEAYTSSKSTIDDALERSNESLNELRSATFEVGPDVYHTLSELKAAGWKRLISKLSSERRLDSSVSGVKDLANLDMERWLDRSISQFKSARLGLLASLRRSYEKMRTLFRFGKGALGIDSVDSDEVLYSPDFYRTTQEITSRLPLVYQHLFSLRPVMDPAVLDGRRNDLARLQKHYDVWKDGVCNGILVVGSHGSGMSSFLNVSESELFADCNVSRITLKKRVRNQSDFCLQLCDAFGIKKKPSTLDELRDIILASKEKEKKTRVFILENLEHLFLRTPSGMHLIEEVLVFFSQTDDAVLWISSMGSQAWQLVEKLSTKVGNLLVVHHFEKVTKENIEDLIMNRQLRSGLPLEFLRSNNLNPLVRRRYSNSNSFEEKQQILKEHFFDALHKETGENFTLAIIYWLNSIELDQVSASIKVHGLKRLNFSFLDSFDTDRAFSLKAFLEHGSLTASEHSEIFNTTLDEAQVIFESFANLNLIEPFDIELGTLEASRGSADPKTNYRIRPLLIQPVNRFLSDRNIIH